MKRPEISVCFPAYNEAENIGTTLKEAKEVMDKLGYTYEIVVVNDGSKDDTKAVVENLMKKHPQIRILNHEKNKGYAVTTRDCLKTARGNIIFVIDSDRQHTMEDIPKFVEKIREGYDIVVGWKKKRNDPLFRVLMSRFYNLLFRILFKSNLHDVDCGFRCFKREAARRIKIEYEGVPVGPEIFAKAIKLKMKTAELPVRHFPRKHGKSIFQPLKLPKQVLKTFISLISLKIKLSSQKSLVKIMI